MVSNPVLDEDGKQGKEPTMSTASPDLVVLGSGAAGLTAAFVAANEGARVLVLEKAESLGGTTAWSGGQLWIPCNPHMEGIGSTDTQDSAFEYVTSLSRGLMREDLVRAYLAAGPDMVTYMDAKADTDFYALPGFPDYHAERPGGHLDGGRTIEPPLFAFDELGDWAQHIHPSPFYPAHITMAETPIGTRVPQVVPKEELERRKLRNERGMGQALVGRLLKACLNVGVEFRMGHRALTLIRDGDRIVGVLVETPEGPREFHAPAGVVLAVGGFDWNEEYKREFLRGPLTHQVAVPTNTGDGLYMAMKIGAKLGNMRDAFWTTVAEVPPGVNSMDRMMISGDRTRPRSIIVNRHGRRFANEAANYNMFALSFFKEDTFRFEYENLPCWLIFDHEYVRRYGTISAPPGEKPPSWLEASETIDDLARRLEIPADELMATVARWNHNAAEGRDPDFHRGESVHDRWGGDPNQKQTPFGTVGPLDTPPYYAIPVRVGSVGTKGGPQTDQHARVLDIDDQVVPGLYAAGNTMASVFAMSYPGGGSTLGPAMVFGYLAGMHASNELSRHRADESDRSV